MILYSKIRLSSTPLFTTNLQIKPFQTVVIQFEFWKIADSKKVHSNLHYKMSWKKTKQEIKHSKVEKLKSSPLKSMVIQEVVKYSFFNTHFGFLFLFLEHPVHVFFFPLTHIYTHIYNISHRNSSLVPIIATLR